jgi:hypothetical protein
VLPPRPETIPDGIALPPLDSLIKILDPSSKYHYHYAQVKYHYSSPKGVYFMKIFVESEEEGLFHVDRAMKLINYTHPTTEDTATVANKFSIGKIL